MNKRSFLKATGVTFVASLFAAPFLGRRESEANAQEGGDLAAQIEALRKQLQNEADERKAAVDAIARSLEVSFIGTVTAIASNKIPYGWHLCDGTPIPNAPEYKLLKELTGLTHFPDYRGVFLRGLDEKTQDGVGDARGFDPNRTLDGKVQDSANLKHSHGASSGGAGSHSHGMDVAGNHAHGFPNNVGVKRKECDSGSRRDRVDDGGGEPLFTSPAGDHAHGIHGVGNHTHSVSVGENGGAESRPRNVAVRYIIKYA